MWPKVSVSLLKKKAFFDYTVIIYASKSFLKDISPLTSFSFSIQILFNLIPADAHDSQRSLRR